VRINEPKTYRGYSFTGGSVRCRGQSDSCDLSVERRPAVLLRLQLTDQSGFFGLEIRIRLVERSKLLLQRTEHHVHRLAFFGRRLLFIPGEHAERRGQRRARLLIRA
jgi:hypothetical protein